MSVDRQHNLRGALSDLCVRFRERYRIGKQIIIDNFNDNDVVENKNKKINERVLIR